MKSLYDEGGSSNTIALEGEGKLLTRKEAENAFGKSYTNEIMLMFQLIGGNQQGKKKGNFQITTKYSILPGQKAMYHRCGERRT